MGDFHLNLSGFSILYKSSVEIMDYICEGLHAVTYVSGIFNAAKNVGSRSCIEKWNMYCVL
jgi:hypothetical protein